jgi:hypothetical protein
MKPSPKADFGANFRKLREFCAKSLDLQSLQDQIWRKFLETKAVLRKTAWISEAFKTGFCADS